MVASKENAFVEEGQKEKKAPYPKAVFFIMSNEFCERFSYYGMRTVLVLYLTSMLGFTDSTATVIFHAFTVLCYFTPLFGAILSDTKLGKFKTIFYVSIVYAVGNIILSTGSFMDVKDVALALSIIGLILIGIGTGGIKPCVAAFGGDQFEASQEKERQQFFSIFYFAINSGSLISTFITPILRADVTCYGQETCFPLAFGVPAILMIVSIILFVCGKSMYKIYPPEGNVIIDVAKCTFHAIGNKFKSKEKKEHWLDYADDKYEKPLIEDVKAVMRVLFMYLPLPFFWALFDQQGSRWTLQANKMDGTFAGTSFTVKPDQIQVINPTMVLIAIPIFETVIYPLLAKCNLLVKPLQRISVGGLFAAASFIVAGFIQLAIESTIPVHPAAGQVELSLQNVMPCPMSVNISHPGFAYDVQNIPAFMVAPDKVNLTGVKDGMDFFAKVTFHEDPEKSACASEVSNNVEFHPQGGHAYTLSFAVKDGRVVVREPLESRDKADKGKSDFRIIYNLKNLDPNVTVWLKTTTADGKNNYEINLSNDDLDNGFNATEYLLIEPDTYELFLSNRTDQLYPRDVPVLEFTTRQGATYHLMLYANGDDVSVQMKTLIEPNSMSMFLQVPQYVLITIGEVMFSITGLEFSYSQAPASMKAVLQSAWLMTVAFGNVIVVIVAEAEFFEKQSYEFFLFAGLMGLDMIIFILMSLSYVYVKSPSSKVSPPASPPSQKKKKIPADDDGVDNAAFDKETDTRM